MYDLRMIASDYRYYECFVHGEKLVSLKTKWMLYIILNGSYLWK